MVLIVAKSVEGSPIPLTSRSTLDELEAEAATWRFVGIMKNNWNQKNILLYRHPEIKDELVTVGVRFDRSSTTVALEPIGINYGISLDYWEHGMRTYVRD